MNNGVFSCCYSTFLLNNWRKSLPHNNRHGMLDAVGMFAFVCRTIFLPLVVASRYGLAVFRMGRKNTVIIVTHHARKKATGPANPPPTTKRLLSKLLGKPVRTDYHLTLT